MIGGSISGAAGQSKWEVNITDLQALEAAPVGMHCNRHSTELPTNRKVASTTCKTPGSPPSVAEAVSEIDTSPKTFDNWLSADSPVDCAKHRLVDFRWTHPWLSRDTQSMVKHLSSSSLEVASNWSGGITVYVVTDMDA